VNRRRALSIVGTTVAASVAGCGGRDRSNDADVTRPRTGETWPSAAKDATNSRYAPGATPPERRTVTWRTPIGSVDRFPPIVTESRVFVLSRGALHGVDRDGTERWRVPIGEDEFVRGAPTSQPRGNWVALGNGDGRLRLFDASDGSVLFDRAFASALGAAVVAPARQRELYVTTEDGRVHAFRRDTNGWTRRWTHEAFGGVDHAPAVGERVVVATTAGVEAVDDGGAGRWRQGLPDLAVTRPTLVDGVVLVGTRGHRLHAFDVETGERLWWRTVIKDPHAGESIEGIAATPDRVYVTDSRAVHALTLADGRRLWRHHDWDHSFGPPVAVDGSVLVATDEGLLAFGPDGGPGVGSLRPDPVRWQFASEGSPRGDGRRRRSDVLAVAREGRDELLELR
jgi:outer membrane protein assembly factor BamB